MSDGELIKEVIKEIADPRTRKHIYDMIAAVNERNEDDEEPTA